MALQMAKRDCPDCGAEPGQFHERGCDVEQCAECGGQRLGCGCRRRRGDERLPWTGIWPGIEECRDYGLFAKRNPVGPGYTPCHPDEPGATEDINRLVNECRWDLDQKRFVRD